MIARIMAALPFSRPPKPSAHDSRNPTPAHPSAFATSPHVNPVSGTDMRREANPRYEGAVALGSRHGRGTLTFANGKIYTGNFVAGAITGHGKLTSPDGRVYEGNFQEGKPHGQCKITFPNRLILDGTFHDGKPRLSKAERTAHLFSTLFAASLAGTHSTGSVALYSLQILSQYLSTSQNPKLQTAGRALKLAAELPFLDPYYPFLDSSYAQENVIKQLDADRNVFIPFGNTTHAMLLGLHVTEAGIEARLYNFGDEPGTYPTCKTVLFKDMERLSPDFYLLISALVDASISGNSSNDVYALLQEATPLPDHEPDPEPQKYGNGELACIMAALRDRLGRDYRDFEKDLFKTIRDGYAAQDRKDYVYVEDSPLREETLARLNEMAQGPCLEP